MTIRHIDRGSVPYSHATVSQAATTFYVRTTGNDSNDGLTTGTALLTIQEAVNRIPTNVKHAFTVDIGSGSFAYFTLGNRALSFDGSINITGVMKTATLATGSATGTSTSGDNYTLTDTGQSWTVGDLVGKWVYVNSNLYLIGSNTSTSLTIVGYASPNMSAKAYVIQDNDTTITGGQVSITGITGGNQTVTVQKLKLSSAGTYGLYMTYLRCSVYPKYLRVDNCSGNGFYAWFVDYLSFAGTYAKTCGTAYNIKDVPFATGYIMSDGSTYSGLSFNGGKISGITGVFNGAGATNPAISVYDCYGGYLGACACSNNAGGAIKLTNTSLDVYGTLTGTGNTGWGVSLENNAVLRAPTGNTITGTMGELTIDGLTPITWASFSSNGDVAVNPSKLCRFERMD